MAAWTELIDAISDYLTYQREIGVRNLEVDPATLAALAAAPAAPAASAAAPAAASAAFGTGSAPLPPDLGRVADGATDEECAAELERVATLVASCRRCSLAGSRTRVVPGQGRRHRPDVMFIGEAPGADEDAQGLAFVGRAGQLLTKMISAMGFSRDDVFIANICKCRPPENRKPDPAEMQSCLPYLKAQIRLIQPRVIVALGAVAVTGLLDTQQGITRLRGHWSRFEGIPLMPTYHPAYLLRYPAAKREAWEDLKKVMKHLGRPLPEAPRTIPSPAPPS